MQFAKIYNFSEHLTNTTPDTLVQQYFLGEMSCIPKKGSKSSCQKVQFEKKTSCLVLIRILSDYFK